MDKHDDNEKNLLMTTIVLTSEDGEEFEMEVIEETRIGGINYLLVGGPDEEDDEALILKDISESGDEDAVYEIVEDDEELEYLSRIFAELLDEDDIGLE